MGRSGDFRFWDESVTRKSSADDELLLTGCNSPPMWTTSSSRPLLPRHHHHHHKSPPASSRRLRAAVMDGSSDLMKMIEDMPESFYELSLKDIVVDDHHQTIKEEKEKETMVAETDKKVKHKTGNTRKKQISRAESMESERFLIKMFSPASLVSQWKSKGKNPKTSGLPAEGSEKRGAGKHWWKTIFLSVTDNRSTTRNSINRSTSDTTNSRTSSAAENTLIPCERSFSDNNKRKSRGQTRCLF